MHKGYQLSTSKSEDDHAAIPVQKFEIAAHAACMHDNWNDSCDVMPASCCNNAACTRQTFTLLIMHDSAPTHGIRPCMALKPTRAHVYMRVHAPCRFNCTCMHQLRSSHIARSVSRRSDSKLSSPGSAQLPCPITHDATCNRSQTTCSSVT